MGQLDVIRSGEVSDYCLDVCFEVRSQQGLVGSKIDVVGDVEALGHWRLQEALQLKAVQQEGECMGPPALGAAEAADSSARLVHAVNDSMLKREAFPAKN